MKNLLMVRSAAMLLAVIGFALTACEPPKSDTGKKDMSVSVWVVIINR